MTNKDLDPQSFGVASRSIDVRDEAGARMQGIRVVRVAANGTRLEGLTDSNGRWTFGDHFPGTVTVMAAGPTLTGATRVLEPSAWDEEVVLIMGHLPSGGSIIFDNGTGFIPGLDGRLNPVRDNLQRTDIFGDNISFENTADQPHPFHVGHSFIAEDAYGTAYAVTVLAILGRTSLLQYDLLRSSPLKGTVTQIDG